MNVAGILFALLAYGTWGITPIYWKALGEVPPNEVLAHRVLWTVVCTGLLLTGMRRWPEVRAALRVRRERLALIACSVAIGLNWAIFLWAVAHDRILETSLGYYLNPLINVVLGLLILGENLSRRQALAMALAALGVLGLVVDHGGLPWVSLSLAGSFGLYGLAHKLTTVRPVPGLLVETGVLAPVALLFVGAATDPAGGEMAHGTASVGWLLAGAGPVTAFPLLCFASAARRLPLSALGLLQYLAPTIALLLAVFLYDEPFTRAHAFAFSCIWLALALYTSDRGAPEPMSDGG